MSKLIVLQSSDGESFELPEEAALLSKTLKHLIDDDCAGNAIPIPNVTAKILAKVIQYCKFLAEVQARSSSSAEGEKVEWRKEDDDFEAEFMKVDQDTLFDLILAANYLDIPDLLELTCETVANMIKGKSPQQIRETFNIKNDFTPEEEAEVLRENAWAFDP